jgi:arylsulfatase A-like enzyme
MADPPNIVVVLCDQMRRGAMSCAGNPDISTPNLDRLGEEGVRFTNANSTYPICVPARQTFVTGEHAHTRHSHHLWRMSPAERTFAHELSENGYETAYIGKWHLADVGVNRPVPPDLQGGFDYWRGFELQNAPFETVYYADDDPTPRPIEGYQTDGLFDLGFQFLDDRNEDEPFCLVISAEPPHPPFEAPDEYLEDWEDRGIEVRPNVPYPDPACLPDAFSRWGDPEAATGPLGEYREPRR